MREALISALKRRGIAIRESGKNVGSSMVNICCPFCEEERFHLGIHEKKLWFNCFVCGAKGQFWKLQKKLDLADIDKTRYTDDRRTPKQVTSPVSGLELIPLQPDDEFTAYLINRDITLQALKAVGFRKNKTLDGFLYIPCDNSQWIGRSIDENPTLKHKKITITSDPFTFGFERVANYNWDKLIIVEGIFDALRLPLGMAVALCGKTLGDSVLAQLITFGESREIVFFLDKDVENVRNHFKEQINVLLDFGIKVKIYKWQPNTTAKDCDELGRTNEEELYKELGIVLI